MGIFVTSIAGLAIRTKAISFKKMENWMCGRGPTGIQVWPHDDHENSLNPARMRMQDIGRDLGGRRDSFEGVAARSDRGKNGCA